MAASHQPTTALQAAAEGAAAQQAAYYSAYYRHFAGHYATYARQLAALGHPQAGAAAASAALTEAMKEGHAKSVQLQQQKLTCVLLHSLCGEVMRFKDPRRTHPRRTHLAFIQNTNTHRAFYDELGLGAAMESMKKGLGGPQ